MVNRYMNRNSNPYVTNEIQIKMVKRLPVECFELKRTIAPSVGRMWD